MREALVSYVLFPLLPLLRQQYSDTGRNTGKAETAFMVRKRHEIRNGAYISSNICSFSGDSMKRLIGFILFWIAVGMAIMIFLPNEVLGILIIFVLLLLGYNLFCC